jgi:hypothetical protein
MHTLITEKNRVTVDLHEGLGVLLKVSLKDKEPPLFVTFTFEKPELASLVDVWWSTEFREPRIGFGEKMNRVSSH